MTTSRQPRRNKTRTESSSGAEEPSALDGCKTSRTSARSRIRSSRLGRARTSRRRGYLVAVAVGIAVLVGALVATLGRTSGTLPGRDDAAAMVAGPPGPEGVPLETGSPIAPASTALTGQTVDNIKCQASEQVTYHVHTHLSVYVNGVLRPLPPGIGVVLPAAQPTPDGPFYGASQCYYWLHVHAQDGVIHIESPTARSYTLGQFFDIWRQPLTPTEVGSVRGPLRVYVNGRRYVGSPRTIPLGSHEDIQIDVGTPIVAPKKVDWSRTQL
jgi:hypothetical protein